MKKVLTTYDSALQYLLVDGFSVMPVGLDKRPLLKTWKFLQERLPTEEEINRWFTKDFPTANIGIITGKVSNLTVIDIDSYKGSSTDLSTFPKTRTVRTGNGGTHLYYNYEEGITISAGAFPQFPNLDIRGEGGFIVCPPSVTDYNDTRDGKHKGGTYELITNVPIAPFPAQLFPKEKERRTLSSRIGVTSGSRNHSIASMIGTLLHAAKEEEWATEVWPSIQHVNKTYSPVLSEKELKATFESIQKKEKKRRDSLIVSPMQIDGEDYEIRIKKNSNGIPYKDMANVLAVLSTHPYYKNALRFNTFKQEIEYNGKPFEEGDLVKIQYFMQADMDLRGISKEAVYSAVQHYADKHKYDEAKDWLRSLVWDKKPRLSTWISEATGVQDNTYHQGIGSQWFLGMVNRIMNPGCIFDYMLVLVGAQGIGKTSLFRIIGGPWYKSYTGAMDNKDFYLALRGALIVDLDEGAALYRSEAIKIKSIITETHDEYRAPYDRVMKRYSRRFVFSMSTNDTEPFRDVTGNRRYWAIDGAETIRFKWLEENRDQLFAEAYYALINKVKLPEVPLDKALEQQEAHLPDDSWTDIIVKEVKKSLAYCKGDATYETTIGEIFSEVFGKEKMDKLGKGYEMRVANIFRKELGLEKRRERIGSMRKTTWMISAERLKELQKNNLKQEKDEFKDF